MAGCCFRLNPTLSHDQSVASELIEGEQSARRPPTAAVIRLVFVHPDSGL